jgi:hypothetical protein
MRRTLLPRSAHGGLSHTACGWRRQARSEWARRERAAGALRSHCCSIGTRAGAPCTLSPTPSTRPPAACPLRMNLPTRLVPSSRRNLQTESVGSFHKFRKVPLKVFRKISDRNFRKLPSVSDCDGAEFKSRTSSHLSYARRHGPYSGLIPGTRVLQVLGRPAARSCSVPPSNVTRAPPRPGPPGCLFACSQKGLVSLGTSSVLPTGPRPPAGAPSSGAPGRAWMPHQAGASSAHRISRTSSFADGAGSSRGMGRRSESLMQGRPDQAAQGH